ncbi:MAG: ParB/RepB/Spo0J family partition protein [Firmicutes bacterium]|jgi:ParB family chromosome partitioning protein|uniref:Chromosome partitioning protein ParB n=1 Tax=Sulfobacillus benefaciens TaxID=453960 RepID=A0A2T2WU02_9FIRM|nr:ParB/RepB/Spo0J family partition protein [Bacillota bacterium]MCL5012731.1 ParB/RepB/Spo0J family partition protein [Bacillota bacterium]PSR25718.1 MAG: chromosome partitioning protein ParB [Sulfobacillus benefaciens]
MSKNRGLGRGLSSLIPENPRREAAVSDNFPEGIHSDEKARVNEVPVTAIRSSPFQPRRHFSEDELNELAESIRIHGIIQPIVVRVTPSGDGYELVAGERRYRAAKRAAMDRIPVIIRNMSDQEAMEVALVENLQRSDLDPIEESWAYHKLTDELGWTQEQIGERVGKSRSHVANYLRLLTLEAEIQEWLAEEKLSVAHAKFLLSVDPSKRMTLAARAVKEQWTLRQLEAQAEAEMARANKVKVNSSPDTHLVVTEEQLRRRFGTKVRLKGDLNKGRIEIPYHTVSELERILEILEENSRSDSGDFVV